MGDARDQSVTQQTEDWDAFARGVLDAEAHAVARVPIDASFHKAVDLILHTTDPKRHGSVVTTGLGKSHFIAQKISATFASLGTPSHFLHPTEAMHGDLGRIRAADVVLALSHSGATEEVVSLATILRQDGVPVIAITGKRESDLSRLSSVTLYIGDITEACPLNLAPTASTTAMLALGDALALTVSRRRDFTVEDFKRVHPGGGLGKQLMPVVEAMRFRAGQNLPLIKTDATVQQAFDTAERAAAGGIRRAGALIIVDGAGKLAGIFTDGDFRRTLIHHGAAALAQPIAGFMTKNPRHLTHAALVRDAVQLVRELRIDEVPVVDDAGRPLGLIDVQDLVALKVIEG
ncbi:MAG: KpsF/GutQ family sugar-phosphate isomerase [Planctomycetes bacterium]|nr:KpsF/GutQ family sugar-phosphate isomerase [Planctomycetota bacterium]